MGGPNYREPSVYLLVGADAGAQPIPLVGERVTVGRDEANDLVLPDPEVSRVHAAFDRVGPTWSVRDLSSRNGTFVNGRRLTNECPLGPGDEVLLGATKLVVHAAEPPRDQETLDVARAPIPDLTRRERDVLEALCAPLLSHGVMPEPATTKEIAEALVVTDAAVRQHLLHLYDKFGIYGDEGRRRTQLAREALVRGVVGRKPLDETSPS